MGFSSILPRISHHKTAAAAAAGYSLLRRCIFTTTESPPSRISPWLMLPPASEGDNNTIHKFYSLAENKVLSYKKRQGQEEEDSSCSDQLELPDDDAELVGSSHGWLALLNQQRINNDLFLSNPISRRHIKLPPVDTLLPVKKVIISSSPDDIEKECRAMMTFGRDDRLAFCFPGHSTEWTPIVTEKSYDNFVYDTKHKRLFCVTGSDNYSRGCYKVELEFECWDLRDPRSPSIDWTFKDELEFDKEKHPNWSEPQLLNLTIWHEKYLASGHKKYLVFDEQSSELFLVVRHFNPRMAPDGSFVKFIYYDGFRGWDYSYPYKTIGFDVYRIRVGLSGGKLRYMKGCLDGLAMFIGESINSFAMSASEFPEWKPNSIYFTDEKSLILPDQTRFGGHDNGIFDYENKTFYPCYYPCHYESITRIVPPPIWFTPSPNKASNFS